MRTGPTSLTATVDYATSDGTAAPGVKYTATSGTLTFGNSTGRAAILTIKDDEVASTPQLSAANHSVAQTSAAATITVTRPGPVMTQATADHAARRCT